MKVAAIQSSFVPWRGFFDFIESVDVFVIYDDVQYSSGSWRNRNKLKTPKGSEWITVPVNRSSLNQLIIDVKVDYSAPWLKKHLATWAANYSAAPYFPLVKDILLEIDSKQHSTISQLNVHLIRRICEYLNIHTPIVLSKELSLQGSKTERLIDMLKKLKATAYLSGPSADAYLDKSAFRENDLRLEYKSYDYAPYPQLWGEFIGEVTILDLIANCGPEAKNLMRSRIPDQVVVSNE